MLKIFQDLRKTRTGERTVVADRPIRELVSPQEWETRVNLAACYRAMDHFGMTDLIYNHITARVPGEAEHFLINAFGHHYAEVTASNLYKVDVEGEVILRPHTAFGINEAGFVIHSAVHRARPDVACVVHTHSAAGMAVAAMDCGLLPLSQPSLRMYGRTSFHDYEAPLADIAERDRIAEALGRNDYMILRNHGLLTMGRTIPEAFLRIYWMEQACAAQVAVMGSGHGPTLIPHGLASALSDRAANGGVLGEVEWPAILRLLDRKDASFRN